MSRPKKSPSRISRWLLRFAMLVTLLILAYLAVAYYGLPKIWRHYESRRVLDYSPKVTRSTEGIAGDPVNVALVGTHFEVMQALLTVGWQPADPKTFESGLRIAETVLEHRSYPTAPVSDLYLWGRIHDLAFEQQIGGSPSERHHVQLWNAGVLPLEGRSLWLGSVSLDKKVGLSHETGEITHHIAADLDAERARLMATLRDAGQLSSDFMSDGLGATVHGRNAGGDAYFTDGRLQVGILKVSAPGQATSENIQLNEQSTLAQP